MKRIPQFLLIVVSLALLPACQTIEDTWQDRVEQARKADHVSVRGYTNIPRVIDVVMISRATHIPLFAGEECGQEENPTTYSLRHRFRTKPGKVSFDIPALPHPLASQRCKPRLLEIRIVDLGQTGNEMEVVARIEDPVGGVILLSFPEETL